MDAQADTHHNEMYDDPGCMHLNSCNHHMHHFNVMKLLFITPPHMPHVEYKQRASFPTTHEKESNRG